MERAGKFLFRFDRKRPMGRRRGPIVKCQITGPDGRLLAYATSLVRLTSATQWAFFADFSASFPLLDTRLLPNSGGVVAVVDARYGTVLGALRLAAGDKSLNNYDILDSSYAQVGRIVNGQIEWSGSVVGRFYHYRTGSLTYSRNVELDMSYNCGRMDERLAIALALLADVRAYEGLSNKVAVGILGIWGATLVVPVIVGIAVIAVVFVVFLVAALIR